MGEIGVQSFRIPDLTDPLIVMLRIALNLRGESCMQVFLYLSTETNMGVAPSLAGELSSVLTQFAYHQASAIIVCSNSCSL